MIAGWDQGVLGMNLGETRMIYIPAKSELSGLLLNGRLRNTTKCSTHETICN